MGQDDVPGIEDFVEKQEKEKEKVKFPEELKKSTLFQRTSQVMRGVPMIGMAEKLWPQFEKTLLVKKNAAGEHIYLEELDKEVIRYISPQKVIDLILEHWERKTPWIYKCKKLCVTESVAKECFKYWASTSPSFDAEIVPVLERDTKGYCFHRLDFNFDRNGIKPSPAFEELFGRISNGKAFMAWIGSLFDAKSSRQQYVWLYGDGRNGKSTLGRILAKLMGPSVRFEHPPEKSDRFWTHGLLGKRLIVFGDCNNYGYPNSGQFKALTGEDHVRIEAKNQPSYSTALACKFLFFSNEKPHINGGESGKRRVIFCKVGAITHEYGKDYEDVLWKEVPVFIGKCINIYKELTVENQTIKVDESVTEELILGNEERYEIFVDEYLNIVDPEKTREEDMCTPGQMAECFQMAGIKSPHDQSQAKAYLERTLGIHRKRCGKGDERFYIYYKCTRKIKCYPGGKP